MVDVRIAYPIYTVKTHGRIQEFSSRGGGGGPGQSDKKALTTVFFLNLNGIYHFSRFQRGPNIFQGGGSNFFQGGSNCLFPIETHIPCNFPGGVRPPAPLWIRTCLFANSFRLMGQLWASLKEVKIEFFLTIISK